MGDVRYIVPVSPVTLTDARLREIADIPAGTLCSSAREALLMNEMVPLAAALLALRAAARALLHCDRAGLLTDNPPCYEDSWGETKSDELRGALASLRALLPEGGWR